MSAYRVAAGQDGYWTFLARVMADAAVPDRAERSGAGLLDLGGVEAGSDADLAASARRRLHAADWRAVEELSFAGRNPRADLRACAALALAVLRRGPAGLDAHGDPERCAVRKAARAVRVELHRLLGLLRFSPLGDRAWLALCQPDHELIEVLVPHFCARFGSDARGPVPFAIWDAGRALAAGRDGQARRFGPESLDRETLNALLQTERAAETGPRGAALFEGEAPAPDAGSQAAAEDGDEALWRTYFQAAGNPVRANPTLQRRFVPERYRAWLPEFYD